MPNCFRIPVSMHTKRPKQPKQSGSYALLPCVHAAVAAAVAVSWPAPHHGAPAAPRPAVRVCSAAH